tara:strand:- start:104 stop:508 length:405 start_codon:yes stop_codon:yes gene_type:complete
LKQQVLLLELTIGLYIYNIFDYLITLLIIIFILYKKNIFNVAMKNKKLSKIRIKLDKLDEALLKIFKKRTLLVNQVLKQKKYKKEIVDKKRIKLILKRIRKKSIQKGIDPKITVNIWNTIIKSYIQYEYRNFKK